MPTNPSAAMIHAYEILPRMGLFSLETHKFFALWYRTSAYNYHVIFPGTLNGYDYQMTRRM